MLQDKILGNLQRLLSSANKERRLRVQDFNSQKRVVLTRELASFWRENVIAVVILLPFLARMS